jgi:hypothetical protein
MEKFSPRSDQMRKLILISISIFIGVTSLDVGAQMIYPSGPNYGGQAIRPVPNLQVPMPAPAPSYNQGAQLYSNGQYAGNVNNNRYDPNSIANPYGQYGSQYSPSSVNNPYSQVHQQVYGIGH